MITIDVAAIRCFDKVFMLPKPNRHHNIIRDMFSKGIDAEVISNGEQGFVTSDGVFVDRITALNIARSAGQILRETAPIHGLFSEDVW